MKYVMLIIDGMMNSRKEPTDPFITFEGCEHIQFMMSCGAYGWLHTTPQNFTPDSLNCISTILGVEPSFIPTGRAYAESAAEGIPSEIDDLILRCNIVRKEGELVISSTCSELDSASYRAAADVVHDLVDGLKLYHMSYYKNIIVAQGAASELEKITTYAPHENLGKPLKELLPTGGPFAEKLVEFTLKSNEILSKRLGGDYLFMPWGQSIYKWMPDFERLHHMSGAVVCDTEIVRGLAKVMSMRQDRLPGLTSDTDTDLTLKVNYAFKMLEEYDFVLIHVNGADEASHRLDEAEKQAFIEKIDREIVKVVLANIDDDTNFMICADHVTNPVIGKHEAGVQPFVLYTKTNPRHTGFIGDYDGISSIELIKNFKG